MGNTRPAGPSWESPFLMEEKISGPDWKSFKLGSKGERAKIRLTSGKLCHGMTVFGGWCVSEGFHPAP